jgi:hypothetical protein
VTADGLAGISEVASALEGLGRLDRARRMRIDARRRDECRTGSFLQISSLLRWLLTPPEGTFLLRRFSFGGNAIEFV